MRVHNVDALDLPEAWWRCVRDVMAYGYEYVNDRGSFVGEKRKEFDLAVIRVEYPSRRPLFSDVKPGMPPLTSMEYIEGYLAYLMSADKKPNEQYTYGTYLEPQIDKVIQMLKDSPNTNQAYMTVGDAESINLPDPPCLRGIQCRVRYGALHFLVYFRSWDLWAGFPPNLAAIQLMKEYMAKEIGVSDGELLCMSGGLHLYEHSWALADRLLSCL